MKRIFFDDDGKVLKPRFPFWEPWGCIGCLWRSLAFLLSMVLIAIFIACLRECSKEGSDGSDVIGNISDGYSTLPEGGPIEAIPYEPIGEIPPDITDGSPVDDWNDPITGVDELPAPEDNYLPPVDSAKIKPDPMDSLVNIVADQIIVLFNSRSVKEDMTSFARQFKKAYPSNAYSIIYYNPTAGTMLLQVPEEEIYDLLTDIPVHVTGIDYKLTTNPLINTVGNPSDPGFDKPKYSLYFQAIQAFDAWDITKGSKDVVVGVVDSYFCLDHPEINDRYIKPIHIPTKTRNVLPRTAIKPPFRTKQELEAFVTASHGTHVASIAIGNHDNGNGTGGIAPQCQWIPIAVGDDVPLVDIMEGILYAIYQGADVINVSMGAGFPENIDKMLTYQEQAMYTRETFLHQESVWEFIYQTACDHNCIICTSAGNENIIMGMDAAKRSPLVVKVEATTANGTEKAKFSSFGSLPTLGIDISTVSAPGTGVLSGAAWGMSVEMDGTSQATPFVTGAIALMKSLNKNITAAQVIEILKKTGKPLPASNHVGPLIQIHDALQMVKEGVVPEKLMDYKEVVDDHDSLIGRWQGTEYQLLTSGKTGETLDSIITYMEFVSTSKGVVEFQTMSSRRVYTAPLNVSWTKKSISIAQVGDAICTIDSSDKIEHYDYVCRPDIRGLLEVSVMEGSKEKLSFNMRKIK